MASPNIIFESRISELEAQLTQCRMELRKAQDENKQVATTKQSELPLSISEPIRQIDNLQR